MQLVVWALHRSSLIYLQWLSPCSPHLPAGYWGFWPCSDLLVLWRPADPLTLQPHLQKNHHHLCLLSSGSSLWEIPDQTTLRGAYDASVLQFTPQAWWHLESTERCFFPFNLNSILLSAEMSSAFLFWTFPLPLDIASSDVGCCSSFSVAFPAVSDMSLFEIMCHWNWKLTCKWQIQQIYQPYSI